MADFAHEDIATALAKAKEFTDVPFQLSPDGADSGLMSPPRKVALATWTSYYHSIINVPENIVQRLLPLVRQCEALEAKTIKNSKLRP